MSLYDRVRSLPLTVERSDARGMQQVHGAFVRETTVVLLQGAGHEGVGEDVTYEAQDHPPFRERIGTLPLTGRFTVDTFSERLDQVALFDPPATREPSADYRRWAFESAALDLALRQAGRTLAEALGLTPQPLRFVASLGLGHPPSLAQVHAMRAVVPGLELKVDVGADWDEGLIAELAATGAVRCLDLKGHYHGTPVDTDLSPDLCRRVAEAFPDCWLEDPAPRPEILEALDPFRNRLTWDAPIHSVDDIRAIEPVPKVMNFKPSRFGPARRLFEAYDHCRDRGIGIYGGGQLEIGPGRGQIQYLASLLHPDAPNDVAPREYNLPQRPSTLPSSPLAPAPDHVGFRWTD